MSVGFNQIGFDLEAIGHALSDKWVVVPINQQDYAWDEEHVEDLFGDLARAISEDNRQYFPGRIVSTSKGERRHEVVDGQ